MLTFIKKISKIYPIQVADSPNKPHSDNYAEQLLGYAKSFDLSSDDFKYNYEIVSANNQDSINSINWFIPKVEHILYGGVYTILRFAEYFQGKKNIKNRLIFVGNGSSIENIKKKIILEFPLLVDADYFDYDNLGIEKIPFCDATISTFWTTCFISAKFNKTKKKFYFIQDYEPLFYAAGTVNSVFAELTYRLGFRGIVNTPGLADFVKKEHGIECQFFYPCVNHSFYSISKKQIEIKSQKKETNIVFYGRPNKNRNAFEIGLLSLLEVKEKYGDMVNIYSVGDDWNENNYGVAGMITNLGRLKSIKEVSELYQNSDIGLVMMFSKHPSYQPFEYMACGCSVVTNKNNANEWFLKNGENCLVSESTPSCIAKNISLLIEDRALRKKIVENGIKEVGKRHWDDECDKIFEYLNN
jgi:glycosyltransferase involved in cell wall biosynthesis